MNKRKQSAITIGRLSDMTITPENTRLVDKRRENMYILYFKMLKYTCIMYAIMLLLCFLDVAVKILLLNEEILVNYFYGFTNKFSKYLAMFYLPDYNIKSSSQVTVSHTFFLLYNVLVYAAFTIILINMEKDLELIYIDPRNSEVSLFTIYFSGIPQNKLTKFEEVLQQYLHKENQKTQLLNISHIYDLREYYDY